MFCNKTEKWLYRLETDFTWNCERQFDNDLSFSDQTDKVRLTIARKGDITVKAGYAWDGCTPKYCFLDILIGAPDGAVYSGTGKPKTYFASLVHDALYQFLGPHMPVKRKEADQLFLRMMKETKFALRVPYYLAVRCFGKLANALSVRFGKKRPASKVTLQQGA